MAGVEGPDFIIAGPGRAGTTWLYRCLHEHPDVLMPYKNNSHTDSVNYFDGENYHKGQEWYLSHFDHYESESLIGEETPQYIHSPLAPGRIHEHYPDVQLFFTLRNPVDRAFSHYWFQKSRDEINIDFETGINNTNFYRVWLIPGYYYHHIQSYLKYFDEDQIHLLFFDDLVEDDHKYIKDVYRKIGVDDSFTPSTLDQTVNESWAFGRFYSKMVGQLTNTLPKPAVKKLKPVHVFAQNAFMSVSKYDKGPSTEAQTQLINIFEDDVRKLSRYANRDLNHWLEVS